MNFNVMFFRQLKYTNSFMFENYVAAVVVD